MRLLKSTDMKKLERLADVILMEDRAARSRKINLKPRKKRRKKFAVELNRKQIASEMWFKSLLDKVGGGKYRRNYVVGNFILDFAYPKLRIGVEIDGGIHNDNKARDEARDGYLANRGWWIIRINAYDEGNASVVIQKIRKMLDITCQHYHQTPEGPRRGQALWDFCQQFVFPSSEEEKEKLTKTKKKALKKQRQERRRVKKKKKKPREYVSSNK